jgi:hypothetical protein
MSRKFDPFTMEWIESAPEFPIWETKPNSNPAPPDDGTINHKARAERFVLDAPGRRSEPGCAEEVEKDRPPIIRG